MGRINGAHHIAPRTRDIKVQIEFFSDVLGLELVALYWMHGVE
ncbi:MAG: VOC family protein [Myxococcota bacterium]